MRGRLNLCTRLPCRIQMMPYRFIIPRSREASTALKLVNLLDKKPKRTPTHLKKEIDAIQELYPQHILLVQVGMFYEIYGHYLDQIANVLDLRIATHKNSIGADHRFSRFAGFPMSQLRNYLVILLNNGYTVAVVEQISPHPASDIINRKVVRIMTPGTVLEDDTDLKVVDNSFLMAIYLKSERSKSLGFSWLDISTGEFYMSKSSLSQFAHELCRIHPKEVIVQKNLFECNHSIIQTLKNAGFLMTPKPETYFDCSSSKDVLLEVIVDSDPSKALMATNIKSLFKGMDITQIKSAIALLGYIRETFPSSSPVLRKPIEIISQDTMKMDPHTIQALEIVSTSREKTKKGSLISVIEQVKTAAGCRLLKSRIKAPSTIMSEINYRLDLLESFYENIDLSERMSHLLNECKDVERSLQRIHLQSAGPADLYNIISTIISVQSIKEHLHNLILASRTVEQKSALNILLSKLGNLESLSGTYHSLFDSNRKLENGKLSRMGTIQSGYSKELDQLRHRYDLLIDSREERLSQLCKLFAIKCSFAHDPNSGPLVEIGKVSEKTLQKVNQIIHSDPDLSITTMKRSSGFKFKDTQWTTIYHEIHSMETDLLQLETMIFTQACENIKQNTNQIIEMCQAVAELDIACQLGIFSRQNGYIRPHMSEKYLFFLFRTIHEVEGGRHPVVEKFQLERGNNFIANNSTLNQQNRIWLLTGPNMGGKSTFLRQCAIISVMAQTGLFIPCNSATLGILDRIFSRIGSADDLSANQSTFMVEMKETAQILLEATPRSLIIMDEVGRGTSTTDGISLALSILDHLSKVNKSLCIFATHYHELAGLIEKNKIKHISYHQTSSTLDSKERLTCLYRIIPGVMDCSHGIEVAKMAGLPASVIKKAKSIYKTLDTNILG